jgi:hypothetical protein
VLFSHVHGVQKERTGIRDLLNREDSFRKKVTVNLNGLETHMENPRDCLKRNCKDGEIY